MPSDEPELELPLLDIDVAAEKNIGGRTHDEDAVLVRSDLRLFAVADGAGGEAGGNLASSIALAAISRHFEATKDAMRTGPIFDVLGLPTAARRLAQAISRANRDVLEIARSSHKYKGMGTTIVALHPLPEHGVVHLAHVGDSRCYRMRAGRLEQLTQDHTLANDVLELRPDLSDEEAARLPRNVITRAIGMTENVRVSVRTLDLAPGDRFLMCSDGLTDALGDDEIAETLATTPSVREHVRALIERALANGADDNLSALAVKVDAGPGVVAVPKRHATRPPPSRRARSSQPPPAVDEEAPEIILVDDDEPEIHVVPNAPMAASMRDALSEWRAVTSKRFPRPKPEADE
jgi:protein phosphatase